MALVGIVYRTSRSLPDDERFGITQQLRRSTVSIPQLCVNLEYVQAAAIAEAMSLADEVSRMLAVMIRTLGKRSPKR
jgi:hypothetical protein